MVAVPRFNTREIANQSNDWMKTARRYWRNAEPDTPEQLQAIQTMALIALTGMVAEHLDGLKKR